MLYNLNMSKNNLQKGFMVPVLIGIIAVLVIGGGVYIYKNKKVEVPVMIGENNTEILGNKEDLVSFSVKPGDTVSGVLNLSGAVKGGYFFEGEVGINLLDKNKNVLKRGNGLATTNWMTIEPVYFKATIDTVGLNGNGYIEIEENDPSDGEGGPAKKILVPVVFENENQKTMTVKLYFPNDIKNPGMLDCSLVYPVDRVIPYTQAVATVTLNELLKGPTTEEKQKGYFSSIPEGVKVNSIKMIGSTLVIDFNEVAMSGGGSCGQSAKGSSMFTTLRQFPTVKDIKMTVNGKGETADLFQP
jgi:hypothetical protein